MKNAILICLILAFLLLILFRMKSSADPVIPPAPSPALPLQGREKCKPISKNLEQKNFIIIKIELCVR